MKLGKICKRTESTSNHYGNRTTEERCAIQLLISAGVKENVHKYRRSWLRRKSAGILQPPADFLHIFCNTCRFYADFLRSQLRRYLCTFSVTPADFLQPPADFLQIFCNTLQKIFCNTCRFYAHFLQYLQISCAASSNGIYVHFL